MAPAGDREGYWGPPTSTLEWCEENYAVTPYIAEFCGPQGSPVLFPAACHPVRSPSGNAFSRLTSWSTPTPPGSVPGTFVLCSRGPARWPSPWPDAPGGRRRAPAGLRGATGPGAARPD